MSDPDEALVTKVRREVETLRGFVPIEHTRPKVDNTRRVLVTGLPVVDGASPKYEKLKALISRKILKGFPFAKDGIYIPVGEDGNTTGVAVVEFTLAEAAEAAVQKSKDRGGIPVTKALTAHVVSFQEAEDARKEPSDAEYEPPSVPGPPTLPEDDGFTTDPTGRDQLLFRHRSHSAAVGTRHELHMLWAGMHGAPSVAYDGADHVKAAEEMAEGEDDYDEDGKPLPLPAWTDDSAQWSPRGTYLATLHGRGVQLWAGARFGLARRLAHPGVCWVQFCADETKAITFSPGGWDVPPLHKVWDIRTGRVLAEWPTLNSGETNPQPDASWLPDSKHIARIAREGFTNVDGTARGVGVYGFVVRDQTAETAPASGAAAASASSAAPDAAPEPRAVRVEPLPTPFLALPSLYSAVPAPKGVPVLAVLTLDHGARDPAVSLVAFPSLAVARSKPMTHPLTASIHWHPAGRCVGVRSILLPSRLADRRRKRFEEAKRDTVGVVPPPMVSFLERDPIEQDAECIRAVTEGSVSSVDIFRLDGKNLRQKLSAPTAAAIDPSLVPVDTLLVKDCVRAVCFEGGPSSTRLALVHGDPATSSTASFFTMGQEALVDPKDIDQMARLRERLQINAVPEGFSTAADDAKLARSEAGPLAAAKLGPNLGRAGGPVGATFKDDGKQRGGRRGAAGSARSKKATAAAKASAAAAKARGTRHLFSLTGRAASTVVWSPQGGLCLVADVGERCSGHLEWFDVDTRTTVSSANHSAATGAAFSPSGRTVATWKAQALYDADPKSFVDNGLRLYTAHGERLTDPADEGADAVFAASWRPVARNLSGADLKAVRASIQSLIPGFVIEDLTRERMRALDKNLRRLHAVRRLENLLGRSRHMVAELNHDREARGVPPLPVGPLPDPAEMVEVRVSEGVTVHQTVETVTPEEVMAEAGDTGAADAVIATLPTEILATPAHQWWLASLGAALEQCALPSATVIDAVTMPPLPSSARVIARQAAVALRSAASGPAPLPRAVAYAREVLPALSAGAGPAVITRLNRILRPPAPDAPDAATVPADLAEPLYAAVLLDSLVAHVDARPRDFLLPSGGDSTALARVFARCRIDKAKLTAACTAVGASPAQKGLFAQLRALSARLRVSDTASAAKTAAALAAAVTHSLSHVPSLFQLAEVLAEGGALNGIPFPGGHPDFSEIHGAAKQGMRARFNR